ncbi:MAG: hypothetical protein A2887_01195 [Alphaproteobacteria bacterium RIFCSPLOWO2_01_FULL_40_26]|nr:MAG: hypothetical protein A3D15_05445 [Alphaproteobacteria bacterium RIFCSPHIGHO2_02_FULL_40_34]OFW88581.1 MAG: hypothetical protein A2794_00285 [Alphaproteobacteria bacterium RIFCSPHIGHO2_01_FULL_40_8]OFW94014.1 MAG: hypothetical protein A2887_01195 [Alphaproteobacteria bacterium RIFCSPLOWO2_01_FULL_40_26]OFX09549.1 MAG: hypothetical protein A3H30_05680 [Alphaproteobacteria bacterium RIFCSPLOWO2_02_FULL_40_19]OFX10997.1 MAG: hypothetical protein A3G22_00240 [Alphaproteobacteria bacterium RI
MAENFLYNFVRSHHITKTLFVAYFVVFFAILYFFSFAIFGEKGLMEFFALKKAIAGRDIIKQELSSKVQAKKNMIEGMNPNSLDLDLLDEQSRKVLGYVGKNEVVVYHDEKNAKNGDIQ